MRLPNAINQKIKNKFGSKRGLLNTIKYGFLYTLGFYSQYSRNAITFTPKRYVFVCAGNICRSPLAEAVAKSKGMNAISFGLKTRGGDPADPRAIKFADAHDLNMKQHLTTTAAGYSPEPGDLVIAMEPKHLKMYKATGLTAPIVLLGGFARSANIYIHDPYNTNDAFFFRCEDTVLRLTNKLIANG